MNAFALVALLVITPLRPLFAQAGLGAPVTTIVSFVRSDAARSYGVWLPESISGPVLLDLSSLRSAAATGLGQTLDSAALGALPQGVQLSSRSDALRCEPSIQRPARKRCWVRNNGLYLSVDSISRPAPSRYSAVVTYRVTETRRSGGSALTLKVVKLTIEQRGGRWAVRDSRVLAQS